MKTSKINKLTIKKELIYKNYNFITEINNLTF